jgi:hypothetical protein
LDDSLSNLSPTFCGHSPAPASQLGFLHCKQKITTAKGPQLEAIGVVKQHFVGAWLALVARSHRSATENNNLWLGINPGLARD